jgi:hypothetical protein
MRRRDVAVTHGGDRLQRPPHPDADIRILRLVDQRHQESGADHDHKRRDDDHGGSVADRRRLAQETLHLSLDRIQAAHRALPSYLAAG